MKKEKILYRLENAIRRYWGQKGYWKARIAMILSYELGSLSEAWEKVNEMIDFIISSQEKRQEIDLKAICNVPIPDGYYGIGNGNYTGD